MDGGVADEINYFRELTEKEVEAARHISMLVEQGHEAVLAES